MTAKLSDQEIEAINMGGIEPDVDFNIITLDQ